MDLPSLLPSSVPSSRRLPVSLFPEMNPSEAVTATSMYGIICWRVGGLDTYMETQMPRCRVRVRNAYIFYKDDTQCELEKPAPWLKYVKIGRVSNREFVFTYVKKP